MARERLRDAGAFLLMSALLYPAMHREPGKIDMVESMKASE